MNDPVASRWGLLEEVSFKSRGKPRGIKPTGGDELFITANLEKKGIAMGKSISFGEFNRPLDLGPILVTLTCREEGVNWTPAKAKLMEHWYRRFLYLVHLNPGTTIVPTKDIDTFWHTHILDTKKYMADCEILLGRYFHHFPYFGMRGEQDQQNLQTAFAQTEDIFHKQFGESPLSTGIADCGALCNEPEPKCEDSTMQPCPTQFCRHE